MIDVLDPSLRQSVIADIEGDENKRRKRESLRRFEMYRNRQRPFILERLEQDLNPSTVQSMRTITSINLVKRITDQKASIYTDEPERNFMNASEAQTEQLEELYFQAGADTMLKTANRIYKVADQCAMYVFPKDGKVCMRPLWPHQYDVIPDPKDPEKALAYIISAYDKVDYQRGGPTNPQENPRTSLSRRSNTLNETIADKDDYKSKLGKYIWWTADNHFVTNARGEIIDSADEELSNPIGMLPFIDIAGQKDLEYWVRFGNNVIEFAIDYGVLLSDTADVNRLQGYAQPIISSHEKPSNIKVGPTNAIWLQLDDRQKTQPSFEFASPSPDLGNSLELLTIYMNIFLSSEGLDTNTISTSGTTTSFASGFERFLAMLEKFRASKDDMALFRNVEEELFQLMVAWSNLLQGVSGEGELKPSLRQAIISPNVELEIKFQEPKDTLSKPEEISYAEKKLELDLADRAEVLSKLDGIDIEEAMKRLKDMRDRERELDAMETEQVLPEPPQTLIAMESDDDAQGEQVSEANAEGE